MEMSKFEKFFVNSNLCNFFHKKFIFTKFFDFIGKEPKSKVLEIGCGMGKTTELIARKYNKITITAIDYDKEQIKLANKDKKIKKIKFMQGDATNLKFKTSSFDYVIEANTFHHIKDCPKAIKEVHRLLKNNGIFYLMDISQYFFVWWPIRLFFPPETYLTKKEFVKQLENKGFRIEKLKGRLIFFIAAKKA